MPLYFRVAMEQMKKTTNHSAPGQVYCDTQLVASNQNGPPVNTANAAVHVPRSCDGANETYKMPVLRTILRFHRFTVTFNWEYPTEMVHLLRKHGKCRCTRTFANHSALSQVYCDVNGHQETRRMPLYTQVPWSCGGANETNQMTVLRTTLRFHRFTVTFNCVTGNIKPKSSTRKHGKCRCTCTLNFANRSALSQVYL